MTVKKTPYEWKQKEEETQNHFLWGIKYETKSGKLKKNENSVIKDCTWKKTRRGRENKENFSYIMNQHTKEKEDKKKGKADNTAYNRLSTKGKGNPEKNCLLWTVYERHNKREGTSLTEEEARGEKRKEERENVYKKITHERKVGDENALELYTKATHKHKNNNVQVGVVYTIEGRKGWSINKRVSTV